MTSFTVTKKYLLLICLLMLTSNASAAAQRYTLDPAHTTVAFLVEHIGFAKTLGFFSDVSGTFSYDAEQREVSDVTITVDTSSVQSDNKARDKHLRGKDFLHVERYPTMAFSADGVVLDADGSGRLVGQLQLLGSTHELTLDVSLNKSAHYPFGHKKFTLGVSASGELQRSAYGMNYGVKNAMVGDRVELIIEVEANQEE